MMVTKKQEAIDKKALNTQVSQGVVERPVLTGQSLMLKRHFASLQVKIRQTTIRSVLRNKRNVFNRNL